MLRICGIATLFGLGCGDPEVDTGHTVYYLTLNQADQVPPCATPGPAATATASVSVDEGNTIIPLDLTYSGLSGPVTNVHFHMGTAGQTGVEVMGTSGQSPIKQNFTTASYLASAPLGAPLTFKDFITELRAGKVYVDLHTAACTGGELRAQVR